MRRFFLLIPLLLAGCTSMPDARYHKLLDPLVNQGKKADVNAQLGPPRFCGPAGEGETCEYLVPSSSGKNAGDVIHVYYDAKGLLAGWEPLYLPATKN